MSSLYYFGHRDMSPRVIESSTNALLQVSFKAEDLLAFCGSEDPIYNDYKDLLRFTNAAKLSFFEVRCSASAVFLIDNNHELWAWGHCEVGQLG
jgi:hypothetical protein